MSQTNLPTLGRLTASGAKAQMKTQNVSMVSTPCLVADIGGTNSRFAIALIGALDVIDLTHSQTFLVEDYPTLDDAIGDYITTLPAALKPRHGILAVASAITSDEVSFTNSAWQFSITGLRQKLGLETLKVINDFAALAWVVPSLEQEDIRPIGPAIMDPATSPVKAILGPGTGLGVSAVKQEDGQVTVLATEAGHLCFAPVSDLQRQMHAQLLQTYSRVSYERLLSGSGLYNQYTSLCAVHGEKSSLCSPEEVSMQAKQGEPAARRAVDMFCEILGAFAGDAAMAYGAWSGVYLAGGLIPHVMSDRTEALFRHRFDDKGRYSELLAKTPTYIITKPLVGQYGAARYALQIGIGRG